MNGFMHGHGTMTWTEGDVYVGNYKNGFRHGQGKMRKADGEVYEGGFMKGFRHGKGTTTYPDGSVYEGDYIDGLKHGMGRVKWANGTSYLGEWLDDKPHGQGTWRDKKGVEYRGNFKQNKINSLSLLLQDSNVTNIAFHPSEPLLLAVCRGKTHKDPETLFLQRSNRNTGHIVGMIPIPPSEEFDLVKSIAFHPTEPIFAVGNVEDDLDLFRWEINDGSVDGLSFHKIMSTIKIPCEKIAFHPKEPLFATCGKDNGIYITRIWRIERATADAAFPFELTDIQVSIIDTVAKSCIAFHPTKRIMIMSS